MKLHLIVLMPALLAACVQPGKPLAKGPDHYLQIQERGVGCIYVDKTEPGSVLADVKQLNGQTRFCAFKVGFEDSVLLADRQKQLNQGKYYQYDMEKDWVLLAQGDSIRPVFYQPAVQRTPQLNEGVLVFEVPAGSNADTLYYNDSWGFWGRHIILLNK